MTRAVQTTSVFSSAAPAPVRAGIPGMVESIGDSRFGIQLLAFLHHTCGAEHAALFHLRQDELVEITAASIDGTDTAHTQAGLYLGGQLWRADPTLWMARERLDHEDTALVRTDISHLPDRFLREVVYGSTNTRDRVLVCAKYKTGMIGLSIVRTQRTGLFLDQDLDRVTAVSDLLFAVLGKHISLSGERPNASGALTSLSEIEACIAAAPEQLPRREAEVCSRILYGIFSIGIALDLGISQETVMTYRKRAYQRLGIASQRELLLWYLGTWSRWRELSPGGSHLQ